jgi:hypothetical protein
VKGYNERPPKTAGIREEYPGISFACTELNGVKRSVDFYRALAFGTCREARKVKEL